MQVIDLIKEHDYKIISVVGMSKNAGKTVALNEIIDEAMEEDILLGITSIGRDGEKQDVVTCTEKPMIYINEGTFVATAENLFLCSEAKLEIMEITDFNTSMGKIIIARALTSGHVQIAGPCTNKDIRAVSEMMLGFGAKLVIVDGALDRVSSASPSITEATVLSTGAVLSRDMNKVIEQTIHRVKLFNLAPLEDPVLRELVSDIFANNRIATIDETLKVEELEIKTALNSGKAIGRALGETTKFVILPGSLVTKTAMDIITSTKHYKNVTFVVKDATKIFIDHRDWLYISKMGMNIVVVDVIKTLAVTINPYAPQGYFFDPELFKNKMAEYLEAVPVIDVMEGCEF